MNLHLFAYLHYVWEACTYDKGVWLQNGKISGISGIFLGLGKFPMERGVVGNWGGHFMVREKKRVFRKCARRCPEVRPREKPEQQKKGLFTAVGSTFPTRGVLKSLEGKGVCPEVPGGLRNEADTRKLEPPKPANTKKKPSKYFWAILACECPRKAPTKSHKANFAIKGPPQTRAKQNPLFLMNTFGSSSSKTPCLVTFKCLMCRNLGQAKVVVV